MGVEEAERSEASLSLDTTKDKLYNAGGGMYSNCPRAGSVLLASRSGKVTIVNTNCNSWRCTSCRDRNRARFRAVVVRGVSTLVLCAFITITYKAGVVERQDVGRVSRDWRAFWRKAHREIPQSKEWGILRVMELTKVGTPHFHLIVGAVKREEAVRCWGRSFSVVKYVARFAECGCLAHQLARVWSSVQHGESYILHAMYVTSAAGAAAYMGKYLEKGMDGERMGALGMKRRWSVNSRWPKDSRERLLPGAGGWMRSQWEERQVVLEDYPEGALDVFERTGSEAQIAARGPRAMARYVAMVKKSVVRHAEGKRDD